MSKTFYGSIIFRGLIGMVFAVFLFMPTTASAQVWLDGTQISSGFWNYSTIGTATINGGVFNNQAYIWSHPGVSHCYYGTINNVTMPDGTLNNNGSRINNMTYVGGTQSKSLTVPAR